ncbi:MAG: HD domain-containing protein [Spirochaetes bacterium]|nr:HD domain-containing protein [Spirochaetota bacterium]
MDDKVFYSDREKILNESLQTLALVLEYNTRDYPAHQHAIRVGEGCVIIGEKLGLKPDTLLRMYYAGLLHDIGKISVDQKILAKKGKLTDHEFEIIKKHTIYGSRILASLPGLNELALWVRWHHEWWNGTGYPDGLIGDEIPIEVQIISVIDCFDSLQTPRLDRERLPQEKAFEILESESGTHFNPEMLKCVLEMVKEKTLLPGKSSEKFLELKEKYLNVSLSRFSSGYWEGSGMAGLYPIIRLFAQVIDTKNQYTKGHSLRVSILSKFLAEKMGMHPKDILRAEIAGLLHDAGKVTVPTEILDKPGQPTEEEWQMIKKHPGYSYHILKGITALKDIAKIAGCHHEKYDGSGYPLKLTGDKTHIISQIISIADTYDAVTSARAYREGQSPQLAYKIIREGIGTQFHPQVAQAFLDTSAKYINALFDLYRE